MTEQLKNNNEEGKLVKKELREWREEKQMRATERQTDRQTERLAGPNSCLVSALPEPDFVVVPHACVYAC